MKHQINKVIKKFIIDEGAFGGVSNYYGGRCIFCNELVLIKGCNYEQRQSKEKAITIEKAIEELKTEYENEV